MKTLNELVETLVHETHDKLGPVKADVTRMDPKCPDWGFEHLIEALRDYTLSNPESSVGQPNNILKKKQM